jgi:uncharacterized protein YecE (DUF72 family)
LSDLFFGTSGWSYKEWVGPFYPAEKKMFSHYAKFFKTVEINSTFYNYPSKASILGLDRVSPANFVFSAKLPRLITHEKRLNPELLVKADLIRFLELLDPLYARGKLGCILIQLPPSFTYERDYENFKSFLEMLPDGYEFAAEFRNHSWLRDETWSLLNLHRVAYCVVDEPLLPPDVQVTADFTYFRWHGRGSKIWYDYHYSEEELQNWVLKIEAAPKNVKKIYGYFNNHFHGYAVENCMEILEMLKASKPEHAKVKDKILQYNAEKKPVTFTQTLDKFGFSTSKPTG